MRVLVIGCGYVGFPLAAELAKRGHSVFGLRRSYETRSALVAAGISPLTADIANRSDLDRVPGAYDWVVNCASASQGGIEAYRRVYLEGMRNALDWLGKHPPKTFVYTSSTGVYEQDDGSWVDEDSPVKPQAPTGQVLAQAEEVLLDAFRKSAFPAIILRVAGIYGPGRGYWLKQMLSGEARLDGAGDRFLNMVHREDVVGSILVALERGVPGRIYNVADDEPPNQKDLLAWFARCLGRPTPSPAPISRDSPRKRASTNKRVSNRRLRQELGYALRYPSYREGYASEIRALTQPEMKSA